MTQLEPIYPDRMPEEVKKYFSWFQAAYGWNPFAGIKCLRCGKPISLKDVYRCFDCDASFHKECLINHCKETQRTG